MMKSINVKTDGLKKTSDSAMISTILVDNEMCFARYENESAEKPSNGPQ